MGYTVIARKYRPLLFEDVVGQEHISRTLMNALKQKRVAHAFIFSGPRGVGKTTTARILAKAVNCEKQPAVNPCNECPSCQAITKGNSMDVIEIDGASNRGIDEVRNIRDSIRFAPVNSRYKIYIIDEVHMLTRDAFNALLKTLEEPPAHAMFIFATTEIHKLPLTILSRCQRYDFRRISTGKITEHLKSICLKENVPITDEALFMIARKADGSMRDSQSLLDQIISFSEDTVTEQDVRNLLGLIDEDLFFELTDIIAEGDTAKLLKLVHKIISTGHDLNDFLLQLEEHLKNLLVASVLGSTELLDLADVFKEKYLSRKELFNENQLLHMMSLISETEPRLKTSSMPQLLFEMVILKMLKIPELSRIDKILGFLTALKKAGGKVELNGNTEQVLKGLKQSPVTNSINESAASYGSPHPESTAASSPDLKKIREKWQDFADFIGSAKQKTFIKTFMRSFYPYRLQDKELILAAQKGSLSATIQGTINKNRENILKWMEEFFNTRLNFTLTEIDFKEQGIDWILMTKEELLNHLKENSEDIKFLDELFDLQIEEED